jgi:hypothetical protein
MSIDRRRQRPDRPPAQRTTANDPTPPARFYWATRPRGPANAVAFASMGLCMAWILTAASHSDEPLTFIRHASAIFIALHGTLHVLVARHLKRLCDAGMEAAATALRAYRDPRRVSQLDIAMAWAGFAALASIVFRLFIGDVPADS